MNKILTYEIRKITKNYIKNNFIMTFAIFQEFMKVELLRLQQYLPCLMNASINTFIKNDSRHETSKVHIGNSIKLHLSQHHVHP
jgi:hypothetical protein